MRRIFALAIGVVLLAGVGFLAFGSVEAAQNAAVPQQGRGESPCIPTYKKTAHPSVILLGETVDITLTAAAVCAGEVFPLHIVLVLDASGSMQGSPNQEMKAAARTLIQRLQLKDNPGTQVGVVQFHSTAQILCQLTNQEGRAIGCVNRVPAAGGTRIDLGIQYGLRVLMSGRSGAGSRDDIREVMIVLSDGGNNTGCAPVLQAANSVKGQGILLITVCVGNDCDVSCMRQAATHPRYFFEARNPAGLVQVFERIRDEIVRINLRRLTVNDIIPTNMTLVADTSSPAGSWDENLRRLEWSSNLVPSDGVTYTFRLQPQEVGYWPTNTEAKGLFLDSKSRTGEFTFEVPYITVLSPMIQSTPSAPPPPPTVTPTPTDNPTPTPTPTPRPKPIYLPILLKEECKIPEIHADVALVLDLSTSMRWHTRDGRPKIDAVLQASKAFAAAMDFTPNELGQNSQLSIVGFNNSAWIEVGLTNDLSAVFEAIDRLPAQMREHTRIDLAVERGWQAALGPNHRPENTPVVILLTDGLPNQVPYAEDGTMETTILRIADAAKIDGVVFYTIGVGVPDSPDIHQRINPDLLLAIAGDVARYFETPDAEDVAGIYGELRVEQKCPRIKWGEPSP